jgi:glycosyltransferase involved in cell wall biosynthesis
MARHQPPRALHVSALPLWSMGKHSGMPSLYETVNGHAARGPEIDLLLPHANLFSLCPTPDESPWPNVHIHVRPIPGLGLAGAIRRLVRRYVPSATLRWCLEWFINVGVWCAVTLAYVQYGLRLGRRNKYSLIYAHNEYAALSGYLIAAIFRCPNVTRLYGTFLGDLIRRPFVRFRYPIASSGFLVPCRLLIVANDGTRGDEVAQYFGVRKERLRFLCNGVPRMSEECLSSTKADVARRYPGVDPACRWLVMASRLTYWKRIDRAILAMPAVLRHVANVQLVLVGDGDLREILCKMARDRGVAGQVVFLGSLPRDEVFKVMAASDALLMTNDVTNRCNAIYEAMRCRLPVITLNDGSTQDLLLNEVNSLLVSPTNADELSAAIVRLLEDGRLMERLRRGATLASDSLWTWEERMAVEVEEVATLSQQQVSG